MNWLLVHPEGGLANRLMSLLSGLRAAHQTGRQLRVIWDRDFRCCGNLGDLFTLPCEVLETKPADLGDSVTFEPDGSGRLVIIDPQKVTGRNLYVRSHHFFHLIPDVQILAQNSEYMVLQYQEIFRSLSLNPYVVDMIQRHAEGLKNGLGLHIRRPISAEVRLRHQPEHDAIIKVWSFPDDDFYIKLIPVLRERLGLSGRIFLATSSLDTRNSILGAFGANNVSFLEARSYLHDVDAESIQDAFIDMLCLARTSVVTKRHPSTFSFTASVIGGCAQAIIYDNGAVVLKRPMEY